MEIKALRGRDGMYALMEAWRHAGQAFELGVMVATPVESANGYHLLFTIGETTAAMTLAETKWLADSLIERTGAFGPLGRDLQSFGRMMLAILAEAPGPHGVH